MNERGKSDGRVVPAKPANKAAVAAAESVEERRPAEGNMASKTRPGHRPEQVRSVRWTVCVKWHEGTRKRGSLRCCTTSMSLVCGRPLGRSVRSRAGGGRGDVDAYGQELEANLQDLHERVHAGRYRARPSRRAYIPKADGRQRPLGIATLEDKIVQRAVVEVLNAVYEVDFWASPTGFGRGATRIIAWMRSRSGSAEEGELGARCGYPRLLHQS